MAIVDYIEENRPEERKPIQVKIEISKFEALMKALREDGYTFQELGIAAVDQYLAERSAKKARASGTK